MTARLIWEALLTELSKVNAPSMLLLDFNYFFNKAVNQYINKRYNIYDVNLLTTDDLRVLKSTAILEPSKIKDDSFGEAQIMKWATKNSKLFGATYEVNLPLDYLHILNCVCVYRLDQTYKCYDKDDYVQFAAKRLTADSWSLVVNDYYNRPLPERPYYYIHNINKSNDLPTNPIQDSALSRNSKGTDVSVGGAKVTYVKEYKIIGNDLIQYVTGNMTEEEFKKWFYNEYENYSYIITKTETITLEEDSYNKVPNTISIKSLLGNTQQLSTVERTAGVRYGNSSPIRCEIRYGCDDSVFKLEGVIVDYIKLPQTIRLTLDLVNRTEDTSLVMEFPDPVCHEIINELVTLVMENTADPRLQTHIPVTQSIANPVQQLTQPTAQPSHLRRA